MWVCVVLLVLAAEHARAVDNRIYRNVRSDYGAKGDGKTDDTMAIINALTAGRGQDPNAPFPHTTYPSSTQHPAYVFFPPGVYLISSTLPLVYYTEMVGDYNNLPVLKFLSNSTQDARVIDAMGVWFPDANQNNFFHAVRNFVIDTTACKSCTSIHWQVSQSTSLANLLFKMSPGSQGIWMENGSGGFLSDLVFQGGKFGLWVGNQQFTSRNLTITGASVAAIHLEWDWTWTFQGLQISNTPIGLELSNAVGSVVVLDSVFENCKVGVATKFTGTSVPGTNSVLLDNILFTTQQANSPILLDGTRAALSTSSPGTTHITSWSQGHVWDDGTTTVYQGDTSKNYPTRPSSLAPEKQSWGPKFPVPPFFQMARPHFSSPISVLTYGVVGDGITDITLPLQRALYSAASKNQALLFPHGNYIITSTVFVPDNTKLVGQAWSVLSAKGPYFSDPGSPKPMLQVGNSSQVGSVQMAGLLLSTVGPVPGAVLLEWNMKGRENGDCGLWEVHFRVGGAIGTDIEPSDCPSGDGSNSPASLCTGAWGLMRVTSTGSVYIENTWGWVADHDLDYHTQINVYNARGFLCESAEGPVWLYGTAMEHSALYQYNFYKASNVFLGMIQTETPYYQPSSKTPFNPDHYSDPAYCEGDNRCNMAVSTNLDGTNNFFGYGFGLYSFFNTWDQSCLKATPPNCQIDMVRIVNSENIYVYSLNTYGSTNMLTSKEEEYAAAGKNMNTFCSSVIVDFELFSKQ